MDLLAMNLINVLGFFLPIHCSKIFDKYHIKFIRYLLDTCQPF